MKSQNEPHGRARKPQRVAVRKATSRLGKTDTPAKPLKQTTLFENAVVRPQEYRKLYTTIRRNKYVSFPRPSKSVKKAFDCECPPDSCCRDCLNARTREECHPKLCPCGEKCTNMRFQKRQYSPFRVCQAGPKGLGLFADGPIAQDALVLEYVGEVIDNAELKRREKERGPRAACYTIAMGDGMFIDATTFGNEARFVNHSCAPNCYAETWRCAGESVVGIFALKPIPKGEEFSFDYNFSKDARSVKCLCGAPNCRGHL